MLRYAITAGDGSYAAIIANARRWAELGVEYVQVREKGLGAGEVVRLAEAMFDVFREHGGTTKLLVNGRADVAVAAGADGVHLTAGVGELTAEQVRLVFAAAGKDKPVVSASCHTLEEVRRAVLGGVNMVVFGPVFEKRVGDEVVVDGVGLEGLMEACVVAGPTPLLALGGVTAENAAACVEAGAAGVSGIRLFA